MQKERKSSAPAITAAPKAPVQEKKFELILDDYREELKKIDSNTLSYRAPAWKNKSSVDSPELSLVLYLIPIETFRETMRKIGVEGVAINGDLLTRLKGIKPIKAGEIHDYTTYKFHIDKNIDDISEDNVFVILYERVENNHWVWEKGLSYESFTRNKVL